MKKFFSKIFSILLKIFLWFLAITVCWVLVYRFVDPPITYLMVLRYFGSDNKNASINKEWRDYEFISPYLPLAMIASEDQNFFEHFGFDLGAIEKAMKQNERIYGKQNRTEKKKIKGASTISQQVAKNVFLFPSRTYIRKGFEVYFTFLIECLWSKERIIEVYMNIAEMGEGIYGAEAASKKYFKKSALNLTPGQAALLAAILPNPRKMNPAKPSSYILRRQAWILNQMENLGGTGFLNRNSDNQDTNSKSKGG